MKKEDREALNSNVEVLRAVGDSYMVDGIKEVLQASFDAGKTTDHNILGADIISAKTGKVIPLYREAANRFRITENNSGGSVIATADDLNVYYVGYSDSSPTSICVHSHPNGHIPKNDLRRRFRKGGATGPLKRDFGGKPGAPPSYKDEYNQIGKERYTKRFFDAVISPTSIHLYREGSTIISAPLDFFKN